MGYYEFNCLILESYIVSIEKEKPGNFHFPGQTPKPYNRYLFGYDHLIGNPVKGCHNFIYIQT